MRRQVRLVFEKKRTVEVVAKPQPLVKTWNVKVYRGDFWRAGAEAYLPVAHVEGAQQEPEIIGYLTGSLGGVAEVRSTGVRSPLTDKADELELTFRGADGPGIFTGKVDPLQTGVDDKDDVQMTVTVAHHFIYAVVPLVAGILLALWFQQRYVGVLRPIWELRQGEARLGRMFGSAQAKFKRAAQGESYETYTIEADVARRRKELTGQLGALPPTAAAGRLDESNPVYKKLVEELRRLEVVSAEWGAFPAKLSALKESAAGARKALADARRPGFLPAGDPRILSRAESLLRGVELTVPAFEARADEVVAARAAADALPVLNRGVVDLLTLIDTIDSEVLDAVNSAALTTAKTDLNSVWYDLWQAEDFKPEEVRKRLSDIHKSVSLIIASQGTPPEAADVRSRSAARAFEPVLAEADARAPAGDAERESFYRRRLRNVDSVFVAVSLVVAVNTGLAQLYYDKPFGTPRDYLGALLWGFAAQTALTVLTAGLQRLWNWRSTLGSV